MRVVQRMRDVAEPACARGLRHGFVCVMTVAVVLFASEVRGQGAAPMSGYSSVVVFGDSLSDTGNLADLTYAKYGVRIPGPVADYTDGRATDGADTLPPAQQYFGLWIEQLADAMPLMPEVRASSDGGTNYANGFAMTGQGTSVFTFGPGNALSVNVENIGQQITDYLATHPKITNKTLFVVWGGAIDVLNAHSESDVIEAGINQTLNIQRLIDAGATQFLIPNLPPLGAIPRLNGVPAAAAQATAASALYNQVLSAGLSLISEVDQGKHVQVAQMDVFTLFGQILANPGNYSLTNVTASSQGMPVDPDTYLFWDDLHPTTRGHNLLSDAAAALLARSNCMAAQQGAGPAGAGAEVCASMGR